VGRVVETQESKLFIIHKLFKRIQTAFEYIKNAVSGKQGVKPQDSDLLLSSEQSNQSQTIESLGNDLDNAKERKDKRHETGALLGLGEAYRENNQIQKAIKCLNDALDIAKEQGDEEHEIEALLGLGGTYTLDKQFQKGIAYYKKILEIVEQKGHSTQGNLLRRAIGELSTISGKLAVGKKNRYANRTCMYVAAVSVTVIVVIFDLLLTWLRLLRK
jgi:tetratricopeptide (TPR) repeat protein